MKTKKRLLTLVRLGLTVAVLTGLGALPAALAKGDDPAGAGRPTDCVGASNGSCSGGFTLASTDPSGVAYGDVDWGDYDDDGDLDILLAGLSGGSSLTEVWRNDGGGSFAQASSDPTDVRQSSVAWGDYDDDGDLDILLAGYTGSDFTTEVWKNDGGGAFSLASSDPTGVGNSSVSWGDYDGDGDLDILLAGTTASLIVVTEVWRNDGSDTFTWVSATPTGISQGGVAWGDYDDDGDLDILLAGLTGPTRVTEVWENGGSGAFSLASSDPTGVAKGDVAWGDYDDDGDLDILLTGDTGSNFTTEVWKNDGGGTFSLASSDPTGVFDSSVAWGDYDDDGDLDILLAGDTGSGYVTEVWRNDGSATFTRTVTTLTDVAYGDVAWGDYDDDGDLDILLAGHTGTTHVTEVWRNETCRCAGSIFTQASTDPIGISYGAAAWGDYDDDGDLDILLSGWTGTIRVTEVWGNDGSDTFTLDSNDPTGIAYGDVAWGDYDDDGDLDILLAGLSSGGSTTEVWRNDGGGTFNLASSDPTGVRDASVAWGDYDDDGDLDILLAGDTGSARVTEVWRNDGGGSFTLASTDPSGISYGDVAWGDYDDDGDLDILLTGWTGSFRVTQVWRNDDGDFTWIKTINLTGVYYSSVAWGDYDDDGNLDILLAGDTGSDYVTEVWRNNGSTFTLVSSDPTGVYQASVAWGDYDDDGDLDILLTGNTGSTRVTQVWRNGGRDVFTLTSTDPTGVRSGSAAWGDYDDDGDLDILLAGYTGSARVTEVWRSECLQTFLPLVLGND